MAESELEVVGVFKGQFSAYDLENAVLKDSEKFWKKFYGEWATDKLRDWVDKTQSEEVMLSVYKNSFLFGACTTFENYNAEIDPFENMERQSLMARPRLFAQLITPNKGLRKWIDDTSCIDVIYDLYEKSYSYGVYFMVNVLMNGDYLFERNG